MKIVLPTQYAPKESVRVGKLTISPHKRFGIERWTGVVIYSDSVIIESSDENCNEVNEWVTFHTLIFDESFLLEWYEGMDLNIEGGISANWTADGECKSPIDYKDVLKHVFRLGDESSIKKSYLEMYDLFIADKEKYHLVRQYFNSYQQKRASPLFREIRNTSFIELVILFSVVESILGVPKKCGHQATCPTCLKDAEFQHNIENPKDYITKKIEERIIDRDTAGTYAKVILEIREKIRHKTAHEGVISTARYIVQEEREITYDWERVQSNWQNDKSSLMALRLNMDNIARLLLINEIFKLNIWPPLRTLHSLRIVSTDPRT